MSAIIQFKPAVIDMWNDDKKLEEIRRMVSPSAPLTDLEFSFLIQLGKATQLNPFMREIWVVKYSSKAAAQIFIGRDGYRIAASRHPMYLRHQVEAVYSKDEFKVMNSDIIHSFGLADRGELISAYCKVYLKGQLGYSYVYVTMKEYGLNQSLWKEKPETMIKKVAEAQALRQAFPEFFAGTYSDVELPEQEKPTLKIIGGNTQTEKLNRLLNNQSVDMETGEVIEKTEQINSAGNPDIQASEAQVQRIKSLLKETDLSRERIEKAFSHYEIEQLEQLNDAQARKFIFQLERV
jgi:phage recombination protein Bet